MPEMQRPAALSGPGPFAPSQARLRLRAARVPDRDTNPTEEEE